MKNKVVYELKGKYGINVRISLIPKNKRYKGDGLCLEVMSDDTIKNEGKSTIIEMKDWEALEIIEALSHGLLVKKKIYD